MKGEVDNDVAFVDDPVQTGGDDSAAGAEAGNFSKIASHRRMFGLLKAARKGEPRMLIDHMADALPHASRGARYDYPGHFFPLLLMKLAKL